MREKILDRGGNPDDFPILQLTDRPKLFRDATWVWEGFTTLSGSRQMGYAGPQPLNLSEMLSYLDFRGIRDSDEREEFIHLVQALDRRFVAEMLAKSKSNAPPRPHGKPPR
jgi:hypothetical protein